MLRGRHGSFRHQPDLFFRAPCEKCLHALHVHAHRGAGHRRGGIAPGVGQGKVQLLAAPLPVAGAAEGQALRLPSEDLLHGEAQQCPVGGLGRPEPRIGAALDLPCPIRRVHGVLFGHVVHSRQIHGAHWPLPPAADGGLLQLAAVLAEDALPGEMLAVVVQEVVACLPQPRSGVGHRLFGRPPLPPLLAVLRVGDLHDAAAGEGVDIGAAHGEPPGIVPVLLHRRQAEGDDLVLGDVHAVVADGAQVHPDQVSGAAPSGQPLHGSFASR